MYPLNSCISMSCVISVSEQADTADWKFVAPNYVLDTKQGYFWTLTVNLSELTSSLSQNLEMLVNVCQLVATIRTHTDTS